MWLLPAVPDWGPRELRAQEGAPFPRRPGSGSRRAAAPGRCRPGCGCCLHGSVASASRGACPGSGRRGGRRHGRLFPALLTTAPQTGQARTGTRQRAAAGRLRRRHRRDTDAVAEGNGVRRRRERAAPAALRPHRKVPDRLPAGVRRRQDARWGRTAHLHRRPTALPGRATDPEGRGTGMPGRYRLELEPGWRTADQKSENRIVRTSEISDQALNSEAGVGGVGVPLWNPGAGRGSADRFPGEDGLLDVLHTLRRLQAELTDE